MSLKPFEFIDIGSIRAEPEEYEGPTEDPLDGPKEEDDFKFNIKKFDLEDGEDCKGNVNVVKMENCDGNVNEEIKQETSDTDYQLYDPLVPDVKPVKKEPGEDVEPSNISLRTVEYVELMMPRPMKLENTEDNAGKGKMQGRELPESLQEGIIEKQLCTWMEPNSQPDNDKEGMRSSKLHESATHSKEKPFTCKYCEYKCNFKVNLKKHTLAVHTKAKPFICQYCEFRCTQKRSLKTHVSAVHFKVKPFICEYCEYRCSQMGNLKAHISAVHDNVKPFICEYCEYKCSKKGTLKRHISAVHLKVKPFICKYCEFKFAQKGSLKRHVSAVHNNIKPFICEYCEHRCCRKASLNTHIITVHNNV